MDNWRSNLPDIAVGGEGTFKNQWAYSNDRGAASTYVPEEETLDRWANPDDFAAMSAEEPVVASEAEGYDAFATEGYNAFAEEYADAPGEAPFDEPPVGVLADEALTDEAPAKRRRRKRRARKEEPEPEPEFQQPKRTTRTGEPKQTKGRGQKVKEKAYEKTPDRFKHATSFQIRLRTGVIYVGLNVICILVGNLTTMLVLAATAAVCAGEFYYMLRADAKMPNEVIGIIAAAAYPVSVYFFGVNGILSVTFILTLAVTFWYVYWLRARMGDVGVCLFGALYTGMQLSCLLLIRMAVGGIWGGVLVLIIFLSIWANDAFAYLFGSKFGKHKMAPRVSPNKSWEGFIAGIVFSMAFWCLTVLVPGVTISIPQALLFGLICGLTSVMGDLCESRVKRSVGFKDSGTIMPGHGGLFDRCDSLMPTAVAAAFLLFAFGCIPFTFV